MRSDIYQRITDQIVDQLEKGVRPWHQPWSAGHLAGRITRPLRANGVPYQGINVIVLWAEAMAKGYAAPIWMTFKQTVRRAGRMKGETLWVHEQCPTLSPLPSCITGNGFV
jgi:antirestriction protein ArdC